MAQPLARDGVTYLELLQSRRLATRMPTTAPSELLTHLEVLQSVRVAEGLATRGTETVREETGTPSRGSALSRDLPKPSLWQLTLVLLWIGATSFGGSTPPYFQQEFVRRRGWIQQADFTEGYAVGRLLPGPTGANTLAYLIQTMRGPLAALYCLLPYALPSVAIMVALMALVSGSIRNPFAAGALTGAAMGGVGVLVATVLQMTGSAREARYWAAFLLAAFALNGLIGANFVLTLVGLGAISIVCNRPHPRPILRPSGGAP